MSRALSPMAYVLDSKAQSFQAGKVTFKHAVAVCMLTIGGNLCVNLRAVYSIVKRIMEQEEQLKNALNAGVFIRIGHSENLFLGVCYNLFKGVAPWQGDRKYPFWK